VRSTTVRCATALVFALILSGSAVPAQPATQVIRGRVLADDDNRPLRRALVTPAGADRNTRPVLTDDEGRFEVQVRDLSASLTVAKGGYASATVTPPRRSSTASREFVVRLARGGIITGRIVGSDGEPATGTRVVARLAGAGSTKGYDAEADDLGEYRISGLPAGRYDVSLSVTGTRVLTVEDYKAFELQVKEGRRLPDVLLRQQAVGPSRSADVRAGEETPNLDFQIDVTRTLRALAPVMRQTQVQIAGPPELLPPRRPGDLPSIAIGPPQTALNGGRVLSIFDGSAPRSLDMLLSGGGAVSGTIVDAAGEPFQGIAVRALRVNREHERSVARAYGWERVTDDRGRYRLFGLAPGSYLVVASLDATEFASGGATAGFAPQYFPGTPHVVVARALLVEANVDLSGADFSFAATPVVRVAGKALDAMGQPLVGRVWLNVSQRSGAIATEPRVVRTGAGGSFELADVAPGDYVIQAIADAGFGGPPEFGFEYVTVTERDATPVVIPTSRGVTLEGRFIVEGAQDPPMRGYSLHASPTDLDRSPPNGRGPSGLAIHDDGRFYMTGLHGPMRLGAPNTLPGWYLKSVTIGGIDVTDTSYDFGREENTITDAQILLSNAAARVSGSIEGQPGLRTADAVVIAFSTSRDRWFTGSRHVRRASSGPRGSFDVTNLPPGEYFVAAVDATSPLDLQAPETLDSLVPRATRVTAREGAVSEVTLRLIRR
jgi:hypothetical protein